MSEAIKNFCGRDLRWLIAQFWSLMSWRTQKDIHSRSLA
jgi:hypothetical protein